MRDVNRREAQLLLNPADLHAHLDAQLRVEVGERLVKEHQIRLDDHGARKRHALTLAAAHLARIAVFKPSRSTSFSICITSRWITALSSFAHFKAESHVVKHGHVRKERIALEYETEIALVQRHMGIILPSKLIVPCIGSEKPAIRRRVVVLPQPEEPSRLTNSPRSTFRLKSRRITFCRIRR